jgi:hypothetical protein
MTTYYSSQRSGCFPLSHAVRSQPGNEWKRRNRQLNGYRPSLARGQQRGDSAAVRNRRREPEAQTHPLCRAGLFARVAAATPRLSVVWEQVESSGYATG